MLTETIIFHNYRQNEINFERSAATTEKKLAQLYKKTANSITTDITLLLDKLNKPAEEILINDLYRNNQYYWLLSQINKKLTELGQEEVKILNDELLIDFGPDTYKHVLDYKVPIDMIHHVLITHKHADHFYHNDLLYRRPGYASKVDNGPLNVYGTKPTFDKVDEMVVRENMSDYLQAHLILLHFLQTQ